MVVKKVKLHCKEKDMDVTITLDQEELYNGNGPNKPILTKYCSNGVCSKMGVCLLTLPNK